MCSDGVRLSLWCPCDIQVEKSRRQLARRPGRALHSSGGSMHWILGEHHCPFCPGAQLWGLTELSNVGARGLRGHWPLLECGQWLNHRVCEDIPGERGQGGKGGQAGLEQHLGDGGDGRKFFPASRIPITVFNHQAEVGVERFEDHA